MSFLYIVLDVAEFLFSSIDAHGDILLLLGVGSAYLKIMSFYLYVHVNFRST